MKKRLLLFLLALLVLTACTPARKPPRDEVTPTSEVSPPAPETIKPVPEITEPPQLISVRDFFFDQLNARQQNFYETLEAGSIAENAPLIFDEVLSLRGTEFTEIDEVLTLYNALHKVGEWRNGKYHYILSEDGNGIAGIRHGEAIEPIGSVKEMSAAFDSAFAQWVAELPGESTSEEEKVRTICDLMCQKIDYNYDSITPGIGDGSYTVDRFAGSEYGAVVYGTCVCEGYALTFQALAETVGLDSLVLSGETNIGHHAWNLVRVDGEWYHVDVTWMDGDGTDSWLLRSDEEFLYTHWNFNIVGDGYGGKTLFQPPQAPQSWHEREEVYR